MATRAEKAAVVDEVKESFEKALASVFVNFEGVNVTQVTELRARFREAGVEYRVVKNRLIKQALKGTDHLYHDVDRVVGEDVLGIEAQRGELHPLGARLGALAGHHAAHLDGPPEAPRDRGLVLRQQADDALADHPRAQQADADRLRHARRDTTGPPAPTGPRRPARANRPA